MSEDIENNVVNGQSTSEGGSNEFQEPSAPALAPITPDNLLSLQPFINFEDINLQEKVGHGSFGTVYKATWGENLVAIKEFNVEADSKAIETEVKQLSRVSHKNIIRLYGISKNQISRFLIMEYAEGGSLHTFLHGHVKPYYTTPHAMSWARQCAEGVAYLHAMKPKPLIHRDLKPLNLLLTNQGRNIKICDFGTVADKSTQMTNNKGSAAWMAPEVFEGSKYTEKCDIFSWAIILWEVLCRQQPFKEIDNTYQLLWKIHKGARPTLPTGCPQLIRNLMTDCWAIKPEERPSMLHVVNVMTEFTAGVDKAEEPLNYTFENQQINIPDSSDSECLQNDHYVLDFSYFGDFSHETNSTNPNDSESFPRRYVPFSEIPKASIITNRWAGIPEESDSSDHTPTGDNSLIFNSNHMQQRNHTTIRKEMSQVASPLAPLTIEVDANAWNLPQDNCAKSDAKPLLSHSTTITNNNNKETNDNSLPIEPDYLPNYEGQDENDDGSDQNLVDMLDPEFRPESPIPNNPESQDIYREHQRLAKSFLALNEEIVYADALKNIILSEMTPEERQKKEEYLRKQKEKEELLDLLNTLKNQNMNQQQLNHPNHLREPRPFDNRLAVRVEGGGVGGPNGFHNPNDLVHDGWVFITNNQDSQQNV